MKNNKLDHLLIFSIIIIIIIILLCKKKDKEKEKYTSMTPNKNHTPNNFVLLDIVNDENQNKKINFGFTQPNPHFIGNQATHYELLIGLYDKKGDFLKSISHRINKKHLKHKTPNGLLKISASIPKILDKDGNEIYVKFKGGLRAIYPNSIFSTIVSTKNALIQELVPFNKKENDYLLDLGMELKREINNKEKKEDDNLCKEDLEFVNSKEKLGDYPNNLFLDNEDDLSSLTDRTYNKADFNVKINDNLIDNIFNFD